MQKKELCILILNTDNVLTIIKKATFKMWLRETVFINVSADISSRSAYNERAINTWKANIEQSKFSDMQIRNSKTNNKR